MLRHLYKDHKMSKLVHGVNSKNLPLKNREYVVMEEWIRGVLWSTYNILVLNLGDGDKARFFG